MESYESAQARNQQARRNADLAGAPNIQTLDDIKRVLGELDPSNRLNAPITDAPITTQLVGTDNNDKRTVFQVTAKTKTKTERDIIMEGIQIIRQRKELSAKVESQLIPVKVNGRQMRTAPLMSVDSRLSVDPIIERLTGGYRDGELICWDLTDTDGTMYTYRYDIFQHRLARIKRSVDESE